MPKSIHKLLPFLGFYNSNLLSFIIIYASSINPITCSPFDHLFLGLHRRNHTVES